MRLKDKVAIVTGAASGFGAGIAARFAAEGAKVALFDLNREGAAEVAEAAGQGAIALRCDVTSAAEVDSAVAATLKAFGRLDIVVNNAGWTHRNKPMLEVSEAEFDRIYNVNVKSIYLMTQAHHAAVARGRRRLGDQHRLDRRGSAAAGVDLVQWLEGVREFGVEIDGGRACAAEDSRQLHRAGAGADRSHRGFPRRPGDAGAARGLREHDPARAHVESLGYSRGCCLSRE